MKDLERMTQEELERAHRDARSTGDAEALAATAEELEIREWAQAAQEWAEGEA